VGSNNRALTFGESYIFNNRWLFRENIFSHAALTNVISLSNIRINGSRNLTCYSSTSPVSDSNLKFTPYQILSDTTSFEVIPTTLPVITSSHTPSLGHVAPISTSQILEAMTTSSAEWSTYTMSTSEDLVISTSSQIQSDTTSFETTFTTMSDITSSSASNFALSLIEKNVKIQVSQYL